MRKTSMTTGILSAFLIAAAATADVTTDNVTVSNQFRQLGSAATNYFLGKLGVGTNNPASRLEVNGDGNIQGSLTVSGAMQIPRQSDVSMGVYTAGVSVAGTGGSGDLIMTGNIHLNQHWLSGDGGNEGVFVATNGNVGVATNAPAERLVVAGNAFIDGTNQVGTLTLGGVARTNWPTGFSGAYGDLTGRPAGLDDGDDDTQWNGGATGLNAANGRSSLGLGSAATNAASAFAPADLSGYAGGNLTYSNNQFHAQPGYADANATNAVLTAWPNLDTNGIDDFKADGSVSMTGNIKMNGKWLSNDGGNEGVFVAANGMVGIGTNNPTRALDVTGNAYFRGGSYPGSHYDISPDVVYQSAQGGDPYHMVSAFSTHALKIGVNYATTPRMSYIQAIMPDSQSNLCLNPSGGNVGIGTNIPQATLDVSGVAMIRSNAIVTGSLVASNGLRIAGAALDFGGQKGTNAAAGALDSDLATVGQARNWANITNRADVTELGATIASNELDWATMPSGLIDGDNDTQWDGGSTGLNAVNGRSSLGLGSAATSNANVFAASSHPHAATEITSGTLDNARLDASVSLLGASVASNELDWATMPPGLQNGDNDTTYGAGAGLSLNGTTFSVGSTVVTNVVNTTNPAGRAAIANGVIQIGAGVFSNAATYGFRVYLNTNMNMTAAVETLITCNTEEYDYAAAYNNATYKFTAAVAGVYHFDGQLFISSGSANHARATLLKNAATPSYGSQVYYSAGGYVQVTVSTDLHLAANDTVELRGWAQNAATVSAASGYYSYFSGHLVSRD